MSENLRLTEDLSSKVTIELAPIISVFVDLFRENERPKPRNKDQYKREAIIDYRQRKF